LTKEKDPAYVAKKFLRQENIKLKQEMESIVLLNAGIK
jgi:hypothetical protein